MRRRSLIGFAVLGCFLQGCAANGDMDSEYEGDGKRFKAAFVSAIENADKIVVVEHSLSTDLRTFGDDDDDVEFEELVYARVELSQKQRTELFDAVNSMREATQAVALGCGDQGHHTVYFYRVGMLQSTMHICFDCFNVEWNAISALPPGDVYYRVGNVLQRLGFRLRHNWPKELQERLRTEGKIPQRKPTM